VKTPQDPAAAPPATPCGTLNVRPVPVWPVPHPALFLKTLRTRRDDLAAFRRSRGPCACRDAGRKLPTGHGPRGEPSAEVSPSPRACPTSAPVRSSWFSSSPPTGGWYCAPELDEGVPDSLGLELAHRPGAVSVHAGDTGQLGGPELNNQVLQSLHSEMRSPKLQVIVGEISARIGLSSVSPSPIREASSATASATAATVF
jgi:hypothetical protein